MTGQEVDVPGTMRAHEQRAAHTVGDDPLYLEGRFNTLRCGDNACNCLRASDTSLQGAQSNRDRQSNGQRYCSKISDTLPCTMYQYILRAISSTEGSVPTSTEQEAGGSPQWSGEEGQGLRG